MGKYSPEYQLSSRVAMSQLKEPRVHLLKEVARFVVFVQLRAMYALPTVAGTILKSV